MNEVSLSLHDMQQAAGQACRLLKVLSNPDRLMILCQLAQGEMRVGEMEETLGIVQPTLSQQLTVLRDEELVSTRRLEHIVNAFAVFKDKTKAITLCTNRFDADTKQAFIDLYSKVDPSNPQAPEVQVPDDDIAF